MMALSSFPAVHTLFFFTCYLSIFFWDLKYWASDSNGVCVKGSGVMALTISSEYLVTSEAGYTLTDQSSRGDGGPATQAGFSSPHSMWRDSLDNLYVAEAGGAGSHLIRRVAANTNIITTVAGGGTDATSASIPATSAYIDTLFGLTGAPTGKLYYSEEMGCRVRIVTSTGVIVNLAGSYRVCSYSGDGGPATSATMRSPRGIVYYGGSSPTIFIAEMKSNKIRAVTLSTSGIQTVSGSFPTFPSNLWIDTLGMLYVSGLECFVAKVNSTTGVGSSLVGGTGNTCSSTGDGGAVSSATVFYPQAICGDTSGNLYIMQEQYGGRRIDPSSKISTFVGGRGVNGSIMLAHGQLAIQTRVGTSFGCVVDGVGNVFISDCDNSVIWKLPYFSGNTSSSNTKKIEVVVGYVNGVVVNASHTPLSTLTGLWSSSSTNSLYLAEYNKHRVHKVDLSTQHMSVYAGTGVGGYSGDGVFASISQLNLPISLCGDSVGNLYIAEYGSHRVRQVLSSNGRISTIAGTSSGCSQVWSYSGPVTSASLCSPRAIAIDKTGDNLYIYDSLYIVRRLVVSTGMISTVIGKGSSGYTANSALYGVSALGVVNGLWKDSTDLLYIADSTYYAIRVANFTSNTLTTLAGAHGFGYSGEGVLASSSAMPLPLGVCADGSGNVFVAGSGTNRLQVVRASDKKFVTFVGNGSDGVSAEYTMATRTFYENGQSCMVTGNGLVYSESLMMGYFSPFYPVYVIPDVVCAFTGTFIQAIWFAPVKSYTMLNDYSTKRFQKVIYAKEAYNARVDAFCDDVCTIYINDVLFMNATLCSIASKLIAIKQGWNRIYIDAANTGGGDAYILVRAVNTTTGIIIWRTDPTWVWCERNATQNILISPSEFNRVRNAVSVFPTSQPTSQPSSQPTSQPVMHPTSQPSSQPSGQPTGSPMGHPTARPTTQPSSHPSRAPSGQPTAKPTNQPSSRPSSQPSGRPSTQPSAQPSPLPTAQPSTRPSGVPTTFPSGQPSDQPSSQPSVRPSCEPSGHPSAGPTSYPSSQPSSQPSGRPSGRPSTQPSAQPSSLPTAQPSTRPSGVPTTFPSGQPSDQPSSQPSVRPSCEPSGHPSAGPTSYPSSQPSSQPSGRPSGRPSTQPSAQPSSLPTAQPSTRPSGVPTTFPSGQPSDQPSSQPSVRPSCEPSGHPSAGPTSYPSSQPSSQPSGRPSTQPSAQPSSLPTAQPSTRPSGVPTTFPSGQPSDQPSSQPSVRPSCEPSGHPSAGPTSYPSSQPSSQPSGRPSGRPSTQPSAQPSSLPTAQPSTRPSGVPTTFPSGQPSDQPSSQPSVRPSCEPSGHPSAGPTSYPSSQPSSQPSGRPSTQPSAQPSSLPTAQPSTRPSGVPTTFPSGQPSDQPSSQPSVRPSCEPSGHPSAGPTSYPSSQPSSQPSGRPSGRPSTQPSAQPSSLPTAQPSTRPSGVPTTFPSGQPSDQPSSQPSVRPSCEPSGHPSAGPTSYPSSQPSSQPSGRPSTQPSAQPSSLPTAQPSTRPSGVPTTFPSGQPSDQPSSQPSVRPSCEPSSQPSARPTSYPSSQPSSQPSGQPSDRPSGFPSYRTSGVPSSQPSQQPSGQPTSRPSMQPTSHPSQQPFSVPSSKPSGQPSAAPSKQPTARPTADPSSTPSGQPSRQPSSCPSGQPSRQPTSQPSTTPSVHPSTAPSGQPSSKPTAQPSSKLSDQPTSRPTVQPSSQPSPQPTSQPSGQPTRQPSCSPTGQPSSQPSGQPSTVPTRQPTSHPTGLIGSSVTTVVPSNSSTAAVNVSGQSVQIGGMSSSSTATVTVTTVSSSSSNSNASALASVLKSPVVTVTVSNSSSGAAFTATIVVSSSASSKNSSSVTIFTHNCTTQKKEQVIFNCSDANVLYNLTCSGKAAAKVEQQCPVSQLQCSVIDMNTYRVMDSNYCTVVSSSGSNVVCKCGFSNSNSSSSTSPPSSSPTSASSVSVAVTSNYVTGDFSATVSVAGSMSSATVEDTTSVLATFGGLWLMCILLMASFFLPVDLFGWSSVEVVKVMGTVFSSMRGRRWVVTPLNEGARSEREKLREEWRRYVKTVLPKVYHPVGWLNRLWSELCGDHEYLKLMVSVVGWHGRGGRGKGGDKEKRREPDSRHQSKPGRGRKEGSEGWEKAFDVMKLLVSFTLSCFLLAWLYDLQYPDDDGSCQQHVTEASCLLRKSPLDSSQAYCSWTPAEAVSAGTLVESKHTTVLSTTSISSTLTDEELHKQCQYSEPNASLLATLLVTVIVSFISAVVTKMVSALISMVTAPSVEADNEDRERGKRKQKGALWRTLSLYFLGELVGMDLLGRVAECRVSEMLSESRAAFLDRLDEVEEVDKMWTRRVREGSIQGDAKNDSLDVGEEEPECSQVESNGGSCFGLPLLPLMRGIKEEKAGVSKVFISLKSHREMLELQHKLLHHAEDSNGKAATLLHAYLYNVVYQRDKEAARILWQTIWKSYRLPPPRVPKAVQWMFGLLVMMSVMGALFFIFLKGLNRGKVWQSNFLQACCIQWAMDVVFVSTVEILWVDFGFPGLVYEEVLLGGYAKLVKVVDEVLWVCVKRTGRRRLKKRDQESVPVFMENLLRQQVCVGVPEAKMIALALDDSGAKAKAEADREGGENGDNQMIVHKVEVRSPARIVPVSCEQTWYRKRGMSASAVPTISLSASKRWWEKRRGSVIPDPGISVEGDREGEGDKRGRSSVWFWLLTRLSMSRQRLLVRFFAPIVLAGVILAWSELKQKDKMLESMYEAFMVLLILFLTSVSVGMSVYSQYKALSSYRLSRATIESALVAEWVDEDEGGAEKDNGGDGIDLDEGDWIDKIMECKSISCDSNDEDSDENALSISFIFSSCSSSFSSGSSSKMFEDEVPQTLVRVSSMSDDE